MPPSVSAGCVDADVCGEKNRVRWANWFLFCYFVFEICECGMPVGLWSFFLSKLRSGKKPPLTASLWALLSVVIRVFTAVSQLSCFSSLLTLSTQFSLDRILKIRGSFSLGRLNQDRRFMLSRDINRPLLYPPPSSRRSPTSLLLFLLACLVFPLTVPQHGESIWKCFLKGSGECCSWGPCWFWTLRPLISMHWYIA